jgi:hypothetical protein
VALSNLFHFALATLPVLSSIYLTVTSKPLPTWVPTLVIRSRGSVRVITRLKDNNGKFPKNIGAKDAPLLKNKKTTKEYIYGPEKDLKINGLPFFNRAFGQSIRD